MIQVKRLVVIIRLDFSHGNLMMIQLCYADLVFGFKVAYSDVPITKIQLCVMERLALRNSAVESIVATDKNTDQLTKLLNIHI